MAVSAASTLQNPPRVFRHYVRTNLHYWQDYVAAKSGEIAALDLGRDQVLKAISYAFKLDDAWPIVRDLIEAFASYMERRGYWEAWQWLLTEAIETARRVGDKAGEVLLSALLARLLQRQSCFKEAITRYRQTIRLARQIGDRYNEARACSNLGFLYSEQGYWWRAEVVCCHALAIFEQLENKHGQAHTESHIGSLYTRQGRWKLAQRHFERACALWQVIGDNHSLMRGLINLGGLYCDREDPDEALIHLEKALYLAKLTGEETEIGAIWVNLGIAHRLKGESSQAEAYAWQAEATHQRFGNMLGIASARDNLALACIDQRKWQEAAHHLKTALQIWRNLEHKRGEIRNMAYWVGYELARGNHCKAVELLQQVEYLINHYDLDQQDSYWQPLLAKLQRYLAMQPLETSEAVKTSEVFKL